MEKFAVTLSAISVAFFSRYINNKSESVETMATSFHSALVEYWATLGYVRGCSDSEVPEEMLPVLHKNQLNIALVEFKAWHLSLYTIRRSKKFIEDCAMGADFSQT